MSVAKPSRPRKARSSNSTTQQVAPVPSDKSLHISRIERSLVLYTPPPTTPEGNSERPVQLASSIEPTAQVKPKSHTKAAEDITQPSRIDSTGLQRWFDIDTPISDRCELSLPLPLTPSLYDQSVKARREFFPSDSVQKSAPFSSVTATGHAGPSGLHIQSRNPETISTQGEADSKAGNERGKGASRAVDNHRWHPGRHPVIFPPSTPPHRLRSSGGYSKQGCGTCPEDSRSPGPSASDYPKLERGSSTTTTNA